MLLKSLYDNFIEVFSKMSYLSLALIIFILMSLLFYQFTEVDLIKGNMGLTYYYVNTFLQGFISVLFALFVPLSIYKFKLFNQFSVKENSTSLVGAFLGTVVTGCAACSITLASYLGLAGAISLLPWYGLELKLISIPLLVYSVFFLLRDLKVCKVKPKKKASSSS